MKFSKYTVFYEHGDNFLLVNTLTGALFTLDGELKQKIAMDICRFHCR